MIRVLHVVHGMDCGGTENIIMNLYRNIDREKVQFDFLVHTKNDCFFDEEIRDLGGRIYHIPYYNMINLYTYRRELHKLFVEHNEWSVIHGHLGSCACIYLSIAKKYGLFTIAHSHNLKKDRVNIKELLYRLHAYFTRGVADYYMGCSKQAGIDRFGEKIANSSRFLVMNNSIATEKYIYNEQTREIIRKELGIKDEFVIGNVSRFNEQKNHKFLISIFYELQKMYPNSKLILVGDGELKEEIINEAKKYNIYNKLILTGVRKDVNSLLMAFDCFVFPSLYEGLGIVLIEAQASGLKCIASKNRIPEEAQISNLVEFIPLEFGESFWASKLMEISKGYTRQNMCIDVKKAGFDIKSVADFMFNFYISKSGK